MLQREMLLEFERLLKQPPNVRLNYEKTEEIVVEQDQNIKHNESCISPSDCLTDCKVPFDLLIH